MAAIAPTQHIELVEDGFGGLEPVIDGTKITVHEIVGMHIMGNTSIEAICELFALTPAQVHAALSYYFDHKDAIDAEIQETDQMTRKIGKPLSELLKR